MKSFKIYIAEARLTTVGEITSAIAGYKKAGEILNPDYQTLVSQTRRIFGSETKQVRDLILNHMHADRAFRAQGQHELEDLYYSWPDDSFVSLNKAAKLITKIKDPKFQDVVRDSNELVKKWSPIANDLKALKGMVVKVTQKRAEAKQAAQKVMSSKKVSSAPLIKILESHLEEYISMARNRATEFINSKLEILKKADWHLNKVAPSASEARHGYGDEYKIASAKRSLYSSITTSKPRRVGDPEIVEPNRTAINRYIENAVKEAEESYRNFMEKMIGKIGKPVVDAKMTGNIWTNAMLTVTTNDNEEQVWHTQMIINFSKYQRMFNQFPTRRKK
jgi:hypothetical protein